MTVSGQGIYRFQSCEDGETKYSCMYPGALTREGGRLRERESGKERRRERIREEGG